MCMCVSQCAVLSIIIERNNAHGPLRMYYSWHLVDRFFVQVSAQCIICFVSFLRLTFLYLMLRQTDHCILQRRYIIGVMARTDCQKTRISYPLKNDREIDRIASLCDGIPVVRHVRSVHGIACRRQFSKNIMVAPFPHSLRHPEK